MAKDTGTAPAPRAGGESAQRGARGPRGRGQDDPRRGAARRHRRAAAGRPRRGRHDLPRHRGGGDPPAALGVPGRGHRRARRAPADPAGHPRLAGLRRRAAGRAAGGGRRALRRLGGQRRRRGDGAAVGGVRRGRDAAGGRHHPARPGPGRRRRRRPALPAAAGGGRLPGAPGRPRPGRLRARPGLAARAPDVARPRDGRPAPLRAHRGDHRRERGRDADGALPGRRRAGRRPTSSPTWRPRSPAGTSTRCSAPPR